MRRWLALGVSALVACSAAAPASDGSLADAGDTKDAGSDAPEYDAGHDATVHRDAAPAVDAGRDAVVDAASVDGGCLEAWCACSVWPDAVVETLDYDDIVGQQIVLALTSSGLALSFGDGIDWLDASDALAGPRTAWPELPAAREVLDAVTTADTLAVLYGSRAPDERWVALVDPATHGSRVAPVRLPTASADLAIAEASTGFRATWSSGGTASTMSIGADGTLGPVSNVATGVGPFALGEAGGSLALVFTDPDAHTELTLQRLTPAGALLGAPIALGTGHTIAHAPWIVGDADGWYVVWAEDRDEVVPEPFGPSVRGRYLVAHVALDGTIDGAPAERASWWFFPEVHLALDARGRLAMLVSTFIGDDGTIAWQLHFASTDGATWHPFIATTSADLWADIVYDDARGAFVVAVVELSRTLRMWSICDLP